MTVRLSEDAKKKRELDKAYHEGRNTITLSKKPLKIDRDGYWLDPR